jgi:hypothetical protein
MKDAWKRLTAQLRGALRSKVMWLNGLALAAMQWLPELIGALPQLAPFLAPDDYASLMKWLLIANIALRFVTRKSLTEK